MKSAWYAAFALPVFFASLGYPQSAPQPTPPNSPASASDSSDAEAASPGGMLPGQGLISEADLRERLVGKPLFLRGLYLDETLHFNMDGTLVGQSPKGSFTLCEVTIDHVRMTKKTVELEGIRYGIHFEGEAPWEDQSTAFDRIQITPKKKHQVIVIDRQVVVVPKKKRGQKAGKRGMTGGTGTGPAPATTQTTAEDTTESEPIAKNQGNGAAEPAADGSEKTNVASAPATEPLPPGTTISPAESAGHLRKAMEKIFAPELDAKMIAEMPDSWQYFYQAQQSHKMMDAADPTLVHPGPGVDGPKLLKNVVPASNDYAQKSEVAGVASYKVILDPQGKILAVAVYRPIGFGLDENAVEAIRKSTFSPAVKEGKPVSSVIDLAVNFRIYSKLTAGAVPTESLATDPNVSPVTGKPSLPGIYSTASAAGTKQ